jgi:hypothetical protein
LILAKLSGGIKPIIMSHISCFWECRKVREWNHTFPSELSFWELEYRWTPKFLESNFNGQNSLDWKIPYNLGKLLRCTCLKWACMTHLGT